MGEQVEDQVNEPTMNNSEVTFDNFTILKELSNIANLVKDEDFLQTVPKAKLKRVKWVPMFNYLKQGIFDEMIQELSTMWQYENMTKKLQILELQKEKFSVLNPDKEAWRPKSNNIVNQLKAAEMVNLKQQKTWLESLAKEYDARINRLKRVITAKRGYLKAMEMDISKYQNKSDELVDKCREKVENHKNLVDLIVPVRNNVDDGSWSTEEFMKDL
ncbi:hypothetical protein RR48_07522 [Papilio machaon]|uniref:Uncharacterized protein n=1 Tax=Papilio machaon TaxID=76193 RepID=A0A194RRF9_PAPMA|nr:hypothetical protein RR48_07522 [Papilio machaon]